MATFAKSSFSAAAYASFRPSYPAKLFKTVLAYHAGPRALALDLGTGHGLVARELSKSFDRVLATDPSPGMIAQAREMTSRLRAEGHAEGQGAIDFTIAKAEELDAIADGSLDMVVAAQAAHWFNYDAFWPQIQRKVRPGGTLAFWAYKDSFFVDYPQATQLLLDYCYRPHPDFMGPYWEMPGRAIIRDLFHQIQPPAQDWEDVQRITYEPATNGPSSGEGERLIHGRLKLGNVEGYARTFSSFHGWQEAHPDRKAIKDGGEGDLVDDMFKEMLAAEEDWGREGENWREKEVEVEWGSVILLARKK